MRLRDKMRAWVGARIILLGTRIVGGIPFRERQPPDDEPDFDETVYPSVRLNEEAREMIYNPEPRKRDDEKPKPLKGSLADRWGR